MNLLDLLLFAPLVYGAYLGYKRGLIMSLFMLLAIIVGLYLAFQLTDTAVNFGHQYMHWEKSTLLPICFVILFLVIGAAIYFAGKLLETTLKAVKLSILNNLAGVLLGIAQWGYLAGTILLFILAIDRQQKLISTHNRNTSIAIPFYTKMLQYTLPKIGETLLFEYYLDQTQEKINNEKKQN
ncbi:MAG: hypothetical protein RLZZ289_1242 [Bacteroidota bacterium]|jgi:membrane protein required for colicin V production